MELTRCQKILLALLAGMLLAFSVLMTVFRTHPGVLFEGSLLKIEEREDQIVYSGRVRGGPVNVAVSWPTNFEADVEFIIGDRVHDTCRVEYPLEPVQTERGYPVNGIRVTKNGEPVFRGGYDPEDEFGWFDASGEFIFPLDIWGYTAADPWNGFEVTPAMAARFAFGPDTAAHGEPALFALAVFLTVLLAARIVFWKSLFRFEHRWARDPDPSEGHASLERLGWIVAAVIIAGIYIAAITAIY